MDNDYIPFGVALEYCQERLRGKFCTPYPSKSTLYRWLRKGLIRTYEHHHWKQWMTKKDWIDEAIMWKRVPPMSRKPSVAKVIERENYIAIQKHLL